MSDVYAIITDRIVRLLENGVVPWHKPWRGGALAPRNLVSQREYRGVNTFLLHSMSYESPCWLTFRQAQELGGNIKRGQKACPVIFWKWLNVDDQKTGEPGRVPLLRYYSVFNVAQCEGISPHVPVVGEPLREHQPIQTAENVVAAMPKLPEIRLGEARAYYSPGADFVGMPSPGQFSTGEDYYSVLFHELTHATGHASRLNRKGINGTEGQWSAFGSNAYSKEELVAEMGAAFLCGHAGIVERTLNNSAAYIHGWLDRLRQETRLVVLAAAQAQHAADFILGKAAIETK